MESIRTRRARFGVTALVGVTIAVGALAACGGDDAAKAPFGSDLAKDVGVLSLGDTAWDAVDATPSPDGKTFYLTATGPNGPGVFKIPAGGGTTEPVAVGAPFQTPTGIAISTDGSRLFVGDPGAGALYSVAASGGGPVAVAGTDGTAARGVEVVGPTVYFTGKDRGDRAPAVFSVDVAGGTVATVLKGAPLADPDAVTATKSGTVYVTDRGGAVYRVMGGGAAQKVTDLKAPRFAGVALTQDESTLLVSALSEAGTDQVLVVDLNANRTGVFDRVIGENRNGGGLHRAHNANVYAWADILRPGRIYRINPE